MPAKTRRAPAPARGSGPGFFQRHENVFVYVPNLIGYARVVLASIALAYAFEDVPFALGAYFLSFVCDELDGRFARMFDQCSEFGKLLDMVTDRLATAGLLMVLSAKFPEWFFACLALLLLDIGSHWLQMYTSVLASRKSHKDVAANANIILRLYYTDRIFMGVCCVSAETLYLCALALSDTDAAAVRGMASFADVLPETLVLSVPIGFLKRFVPTATVVLNHRTSLATQVAALTLPGFLIKQWANVAQLIASCAALAEHDAPKRKRK
jgi:CDP-diacylglycerol--inositol 3-phosphatidyltransferase